ncbi:LCP family protein [Gordonia shandongensis]|uniref:LCP family protein n=1 Tax=Gordonia shandongensis TaxID=376351 RepID=UPI00040F9971|nr:LCP family protein [Gordonia shandongensis]
MSSDRPGSPEPGDETPQQPRRSRRAGRTSGSYDFRTRFGDATGETPAVGSDDDRVAQEQRRRDGLREPSAREGYVRPRGRLTVRQLMEQMGVDEPPADPPGRPRPPARPPHPEPPQPEPLQPEPSPRVDVTQVIPPVADAPAVDLSDETTAARLSAESRAQGPVGPPASPESEQSPSAGARHGEPRHGEPRTPESQGPDPQRRRHPLEPTPDLTEAISRVRGREPRQISEPRGPRDGRSGAATTKTRRYATNSGRVLLALACLLSLVGTGYVWKLNRGWNGAWNVIKALDPDSKDVRKPQDQVGDETYLIVGTDSRAGKNSRVGAGSADLVEGARSDTVLLVNIPADRSRVVAVSWPRDLAVDRPDCQGWDNSSATYSGSLPAATGVKLNGVYAEGGPQCLVKTLTAMSGLDINHFIAMDFSGFEKIVRAVGGVEVCSTVPLYDYELGPILRKAGRKKLNGRFALNYVRARHVQNETNGDYGRIKRQQLFMSSLLRSTLSNDVLSNPSKLTKIVETFIEYSYVDRVDTDSLIQLAESMQGMDAGAVTFLTIPTSGTTTDGENNEIPRTDDIDAIFNAIIDDDPLPGEKKPPKPKRTKSSTKAPAPQELTAQNAANLSVRVLNGTGADGLAGETQSVLLHEGISVPGIADSSETRTDTIVRYGPGEKNSAATVAAMFPGARIQEDRTVKYGVEVILGDDFGGSSTIASPPSPGSTLTVDELPAHSDSKLPNDLSVTNAGDTTCS